MSDKTLYPFPRGLALLMISLTACYVGFQFVRNVEVETKRFEAEAMCRRITICTGRDVSPKLDPGSGDWFCATEAGERVTINGSPRCE